MQGNKTFIVTTYTFHKLLMKEEIDFPVMLVDMTLCEEHYSLKGSYLKIFKGYYIIIN